MGIDKEEEEVKARIILNLRTDRLKVWTKNIFSE
jgi:hypothetical protein